MIDAGNADGQTGGRADGRTHHARGGREATAAQRRNERTPAQSVRLSPFLPSFVSRDRVGVEAKKLPVRPPRSKTRALGRTILHLTSNFLASYCQPQSESCPDRQTDVGVLLLLSPSPSSNEVVFNVFTGIPSEFRTWPPFHIWAKCLFGSHVTSPSFSLLSNELLMLIASCPHSSSSSSSSFRVIPIGLKVIEHRRSERVRREPSCLTSYLRVTMKPQWCVSLWETGPIQKRGSPFLRRQQKCNPLNNGDII